MKVTVIGAGNVGATTAMRIAESDVCREVVLVDVAPGLAEGLALDLGQSAPIEGFRTRDHGLHRLRGDRQLRRDRDDGRASAQPRA